MLAVDLPEGPRISKARIENLVDHLGGLCVVLALGMVPDRKSRPAPDTVLVVLGEVPDSSREGFPGPSALATQAGRTYLVHQRLALETTTVTALCMYTSEQA